MLIRKIALLVVLVCLLSVGSAFAQSQSVALVVQVDFGRVQMYLPEEWVFEVADLGAPVLFAANSENALEAVRDGEEGMTPAEFGMTVLTPEAMESNFSIDTSTEALQALDELAAAYGVTEPEIVPAQFGIHPGAVMILESDRIPLGRALFYASQNPEGTVIAGVQFGNPALYDDPEADLEISETLIRILGTIWFPLGTEPAVEPDSNVFVSEFDDLSFELPEGWAAQSEAGRVTVASSAEALELVQNGSEMGADQMQLLVIAPSGLSELELANDAPAAVVLNTFLRLNNLEGEVMSDFVNDQPASFVIVDELPESASSNQALAAIAIETANGTVFMLGVTGGDPRDFSDDLAVITNSLSTEPVDRTAQTTQVNLNTLTQFAVDATGTSQYRDTSWSFQQATGTPDTEACGDIATAWASSNSRGEDVLQLTYSEAVIPTLIEIYQTYNPGSIISISVGNSQTGEVFELPNSADPPGNTPCPGVFAFEVTGVTEPVDTVIIELDQRIGGSWNEIDAVALTGVPAE